MGKERDQSQRKIRSDHMRRMFHNFLWCACAGFNAEGKLGLHTSLTCNAKFLQLLDKNENASKQQIGLPFCGQKEQGVKTMKNHWNSSKRFDNQRFLNAVTLTCLAQQHPCMISGLIDDASDSIEISESGGIAVIGTVLYSSKLTPQLMFGVGPACGWFVLENS